MTRSVFISLTHADSPLAAELRELLRTLFGDFLKVRFSTSKELEGGIRSGEDWFQWIVGHVTSCDIALVLITPTSLNKPWILWEAGAVAGAAMATQQGGLRKVRPIVYQVDSDLIPSPLRDSKLQFRRGDHVEDVKALMSEMLLDYVKDLAPDRIAGFGGTIDGAVARYRAAVLKHLENAPAVATPAVLDEWRRRLEDLLAQNRASEVRQFHDWMDIAFGRHEDARDQPLDLRIHARLGAIYLKARDIDRAIEQIDLARQLAPRDIYLLLMLGRAYLDRRSRDDAKRTIDRIRELDPRAFEHNADCTALLARWYREGGDPRQAAATYTAALTSNPTSYYLANGLAEAELEAGNTNAAREAFERSLKITRELKEPNIWSSASSANAAFFLGRDDEARGYLEAVVKQGVDAAARSTIERGLRRIAEHVNDGPSRCHELIARLP